MFLRNFVTPSATRHAARRDRRRRLLGNEPALLRRHGLLDSLHRRGKNVSVRRRLPLSLSQESLRARPRKRCAARSEEFADIVAGYVNICGLRERTLRRFAAKAYLRAAEFHANGNPNFDPSADATRAATLVFKAWRLKPKRLDYFLEGGQAAGRRSVASPDIGRCFLSEFRRATRKTKRNIDKRRRSTGATARSGMSSHRDVSSGTNEDGQMNDSSYSTGREIVRRQRGRRRLRHAAGSDDSIGARVAASRSADATLHPRRRSF